MKTKNNSSFNTTTWMAGIIIFAMVGSFIFMKIMPGVPEAAKQQGRYFMDSIKNKEFSRAAIYLVHKTNLKPIASGKKHIQHYKLVGQGANSDREVWLHYYVTGYPAETRNISVKMFMEKKAWWVKQIKITPHFNPLSKKTALRFLFLHKQCRFKEAVALMKEGSRGIAGQIQIFVRKYPSDATWRLTSARNLPRTGKGSSWRNKPLKTDLWFLSPDKKYRFLIRTAVLKGKAWVNDTLIYKRD